jgi:hypothetical protein
MMKLDGLDHVLDAKQCSPELYLVGWKDLGEEQRQRLPGSHQDGSIGRTVVPDHQCAVVIDPDFGMNPADRFVGDSEVAGLLPAYRELARHSLDEWPL